MDKEIPTAQLSRQFLNFFYERVARKQSFALITVLSTHGSSYSKAGHELLIDDVGDVQEILSGGCLERDLAERSINAISTMTPEVIEYDLSADEELFGLGVGCEGSMRVLIQPLSADSAYEPPSSILDSLETGVSVNVKVTLDFDA